MKKGTTVNQILLGDEVGKLVNELLAGGFQPQSLVIVGLSGDTVRVRHNCRNLAELLGILSAVVDNVRIGYETK